eukprot:362326-Chlamydomonas_euryale.AAC.3
MPVLSVARQRGGSSGLSPRAPPIPLIREGIRQCPPLPPAAATTQVGAKAESTQCKACYMYGKAAAPAACGYPAGTLPSRRGWRMRSHVSACPPCCYPFLSLSFLSVCLAGFPFFLPALGPSFAFSTWRSFTWSMSGLTPSDPFS